MKHEHTPGPWTMRRGIGEIHIKSDDGIVCIVIRQPDIILEPNARLISAAPDLLEALENLCNIALPIFNRYDDEYEANEMKMGAQSPDSIFIALNAARAAIAKATTPQP